VPASSSPLAEQPRTIRWWLRAIRRNPVLAALIAVPFLITPVIWGLWHPPGWLKLLVTLAVVGPAVVLIDGVRERTARALEAADETAERTGRRRPVSAGTGADLRSTFSWTSRIGHRLIVMGVLGTGLTTLGAVMVAWTWHDDPPHSVRDTTLAVSLVFLLVIFPAAMFALNVGGLLRQVQRTLADPAERAFVTAIGLDPGTGQWVLERLDNGHRLCARLLVGRRLLVAGDELLAEGTLHKSASRWSRPIPPMFALTGPFGTLWAQHGDLPQATITSTTATGVPRTQRSLPERPSAGAI
jgi:hypothetical protein